MTIDANKVKELSTEELEKELAKITADKEDNEYSNYYTNYHDTWRIKRELRNRRKLEKVSKATKKHCDNCSTRLLCTMSNANGAVYARDKLDMTLDGADLEFFDKDCYTKEKKPKFSIPIVKAGFQFSVLPLEINEECSVSFYQEKVRLAYRLMPLNYNKRTKVLSFVKYDDLPKTQLEYDRNYEYYTLVFDNVISHLYSGINSWYSHYDDKDYRLNTTKLYKFQCPIFLEETFIKSLRAIRGQGNIKQSVRVNYCNAVIPKAGNILKKGGSEAYNILTLHQMKKNNVYLPIKIKTLNKTQAELTKFVKAYKKSSGIVDLSPKEDFPKEIW